MHAILRKYKANKKGADQKHLINKAGFDFDLKQTDKKMGLYF